MFSNTDRGDTRGMAALEAVVVVPCLVSSESGVRGGLGREALLVVDVLVTALLEVVVDGLVRVTSLPWLARGAG